MPEAASRDAHAANRMSDAPPVRDSRPAAQGSVLAFDFGERYVGVAVGDTVTGIAHPLETIDAEASAPRFAAIARLVAEWQPVLLVVGLPLSLDGEEHELTRRARRFARQVEGRFGLPVAFADERLSSADAEARLREAGRGGRRNKDLVHPVAAQIILQAYFDDLRAA
jgi:putative Holliday junction resolvase